MAGVTLKYVQTVQHLIQLAVKYHLMAQVRKLSTLVEIPTKQKKHKIKQFKIINEHNSQFNYYINVL